MLKFLLGSWHQSWGIRHDFALPIVADSRIQRKLPASWFITTFGNNAGPTPVSELEDDEGSRMKGDLGGGRRLTRNKCILQPTIQKLSSVLQDYRM